MTQSLSLAPHKIEIKRKVLSNCQLNIFFNKEKYVLHYENLQLYLRLGLKLKNTSSLYYNSITCDSRNHMSNLTHTHTHTHTNTKKRNRKNGDKDGKALYKLMNNAVYGKTMENLRNRSYVNLLSNKKDCLKRTLKPSYMSLKDIWQWLSCNT